MKAVISYFAVLLSAVAYAVLFDRSAGSIMTLFLVVVPMVSVFLTVFASQKMQFELNVNENMLKKKRKSTVTVRAVKNTFLPLPVLSFELSVSEHFQRPEYDVYRFSMSENREAEISAEIFPEICGRASLIAGKFRITDYLGIFSFRLRVPDISESIIIIPQIHETDDSSEIIHSIFATLPDNDDDESSSFVFGRAAVPGYEYRSYVPGDPLKKINWKLSSKKNELFVRMDESGGMTLPNIILDIHQSGADKNRRSGLCIYEQIVEGALSLLNECINNGIECRFTYPRSGVMYTESVSQPEDTERISSEIFRYMNEPGKITLHHDKSSKSSEVSIIFAAEISEELAAAAEISVSEGNSVRVIVPEQVYSHDMSDVPELWIQKDDFSLTRIM